MAEEVKKAPKPVDVNSAKYKLGKIAADAYVDAIEAKRRGEKVAWVSSNFPVEIPETMGIATVYPENQAAGIAARGAGTRMCEVAESEGYSNDICAYARVSLAYAKLKSCPEQDVAMPDVLLCCSNICSCMIKWYENLARELNIAAEGIEVGPSPADESMAADLALPIEDLNMSVRSYNCLKRAGIHSVRQLVEFSENDLLNIRNFGAKSIEEVKDKLISMDLNLKQ